MKQYVHGLQKGPIKKMLIILLFVIAGFTSCRKEPGFRQDFPASLYSADVIDKWMTLEIRIYKNATGIANGAFARPFSYSGISAYESTDPGLASWKNKYNGLSDLPETDHSKKYNWPASVNASLAEFNRSFFTTSNLNATDLAAIDSLENAISASFGGENTQTLSRSVAFGKSIADAVFAWGQTDGYLKIMQNPIRRPWVWVSGCRHHQPMRRPAGPTGKIIVTSLQAVAIISQPGPPMAYSEDPGSDFYKMVNEVYQASKVLTTEQKNQAIFWRDVPGTTPAHWMSITRQAIAQSHSPLDKAALGYALVGICLNEAVISVFKSKYVYTLIRPVTYIRRVMGDTAWLPIIATPSHPEYLSAHGVVSGSAAEGLTAAFGNIGSLTDHTYDFLGLPARTFNTFREFAQDAVDSRFYGGIHYKPSLKISLGLGKIVGDNVINSLSSGIDWKK